MAKNKTMDWEKNVHQSDCCKLKKYTFFKKMTSSTTWNVDTVFSGLKYSAKSSFKGTITG